MPVRLFFLFLIFLGLSAESRSQGLFHVPPGNLRKKWVSTRKDTLDLDSLSIDPSTFFLQGVPAGTYRLDPVRARLTWLKRIAADSVRVQYRVFPSRLNEPYFHKNPAELFKGYIITPYTYQGAKNSGTLLDFGNLDYAGSLGRGISFGNNQDVVVNSNLNLRISGMLADSIRLEAAITDNNIPFQPQGNTQTIQEFDKVFIRFSKKQHALTLGDFDLQPEGSHFMKFYKRLQGVSFSSGFQTSPKGFNSYGVSAAEAKGIYTQNIFEGSEGNQGPYRLHGANGELFFIVLAGTEKVYLDGQLLKRGQGQDYIIDYNTAEITFMPRRLITKDSRIQVEFEYSNQYFLNSQVYAQDQWKLGSRFQFHLNLYSNQDARNSPISQNLDPAQTAFLSGLGDSVSQAYYPSLSRDTFSASQVLYTLGDSLVGGQRYDSVLRYSTQADSVLYSVGFSNLGPGQGDYQLVQNNANGKVFQWIAPQNGLHQGDYAPVSFLVTPKKQQLLSIGADWKLNDHSGIRTELSLSNRDQNTYSQLQKGTDHGAAAYIGYYDNRTLKKGPGYTLGLHSALSYEYSGKNFQAIAPYRNVEFNRDWGLPLNDLLQGQTQHLGDASLELDRSDLGQLRYELSSYFLGQDYAAYRNIISASLHQKGFHVSGTFNIMNSQGLGEHGSYLRPGLDLSREFRRWKGLSIGARYSLERDAQYSLGSDTLEARSFSFHTLEFYALTAPGNPNRGGISLQFRGDQGPLPSGFRNADHSQTLNLFGQWAKSRIQQLKWNLTFRNLQVSDSQLTGQSSLQSLLGRLEYNLNAWKGLIRAYTLYGLGSGQQQKLQYSYVQVPAGQGQYTWIDYNKDGIQQVNEFEPAAFQDQADFVRILIPTNEFIRTNNVQFSQHFSLDPASLFGISKSGGFKGLLDRFMTRTSFQIDRNELARGLTQFNPFGKGAQDSSLIANSSLISNALLFNSLSPVWGLDLTQTRSDTKALLTYGFDLRSLSSNQLRFRWNLSHRFMLELNGRQGRNKDIAPSYLNQSYDFSYSGFTPRLTYTYQSSFRASLSYGYDQRQNALYLGGGKSESGAMVGAVKFNILGSGTLGLSFTYNQISFNGNPNSTLGFNMLNGLLPGTNLLWNINLEKRLGGNLEMNLEYNGRQSGTQRAIQTGRVTVQALF